ncbi:MAG: AMP-binding protein [Candidatus Cryptobacteroides sp.]
MYKFIYKNLKKVREKYIDTLAKLYEFSTTVYNKNQFTQWADSKTGGYTYADLKHRSDALSKKLTQYGIGAGDKVAILSQSMPNWSAAFFSIVPFGRIAIPILPDSSENEVTNIINHSESKVIFVSQRLASKVSAEIRKKMTLVIDMDTFEVLNANEDQFTCDGKTSLPTPEDIATIIYTSGTTGSAKGVVLSHRNLTSNVISCYRTCKRTSKDRWLSILPMAHTLEMTICMLYPMYCGATVYYLSKPPVASILMKALKTVKPTTMLSVPLIIEKVYKASVVPTIQKSRTLTWMNEHMNGFMCRIIGMKLRKVFGGHITFFGIGGAKMDSEVEAFLLKAKFPYAIGYGLTETSPLLSYAMGRGRTVGSIGYPVKGVRLKLNDVNPETGEGEIVAKGDNVMLGYYKDPKRTKSVFTEDGWFRTNDLAVQDEKGRFFIKGRKNNMILGPSGENIYPEEIENVINNIDGVNESIVVERNGRLVALVQLDENMIEWDKEGEDEFYKKLDARKAQILNFVNKQVSKFSKVNDVEVMKEPFEKTATSKIRRFKYKDSAHTVESDKEAAQTVESDKEAKEK